jgi:hypothetical protein
MPKRISFEVGDRTLREVRVLAADAETSVGGAMRALVKLWRADATLQRRVRAAAEPRRRSTRVTPDE